MNRAVGARGSLGWVTIPRAMPQADIKRAFGPNLTTTPGDTMGLSPTFNHTLRLPGAMSLIAKED